MLVNSPRPAKMDMGCQLSALTKTPLVLQSKAVITSISIALRRSVREVMDNPLGFEEKPADYNGRNSTCSLLPH